MKSILVTTLALVLIGSTALASELYCGANIETDPGSQNYNKLVFWEKVDPSKPLTHFLKPDGTLLIVNEATPEAYEQIENGSLALGISIFAGRPTVFIGVVKRNGNNQIEFAETALAGSLDGYEPLLISHGVSLVCKQM